ncbi:RDD family protein [Paenibacillus faecis]|uniref:RDD family protein n=1 Tax=Paenibacillus faecis TaxID=862114 RepID=UPI001B0FF0E1|nr:RDD family protein [Paenibacillus faecis]GIO86809.1 RDD family protein [Paenibacillus faecis]
MYDVFWRRYWAWAVDKLVAGIGGILLSLLFFSPGRLFAESPDTAAAGVPMLLTLVSQCLYFSLMESSKYQATLGKMLLGIVVVNRNYERLTYGKALVRYLGRLLSALTFGIGYIMAAFTKNKQALHDLVADTYVLNKSLLKLLDALKGAEGEIRVARAPGNL